MKLAMENGFGGVGFTEMNEQEMMGVDGGEITTTWCSAVIDAALPIGAAAIGSAISKKVFKNIGKTVGGFVGGLPGAFIGGLIGSLVSGVVSDIILD